MKGKWMGMVFLGTVVAGAGWWLSARQKAETGRGERTVAERSAEDQRLVDAVLESPERLDAEDVAAMDTAGLEKEGGLAGNPRYEGGSAVPVCTLPTGRERHLLSDVEKPPAPQPLKEPVAADSLQFRKEYASLRKDAIRNPDSAENRAGVVSLMEARQRRLGQK